MGAIDTIRHGKARNRSACRATFAPRLLIVLTSMVAWLEARLDRRRSRQALLELTDDQLKDIGISRADAYREGIRSFLD